jgi:hypothetical protein
MPARRLGQWISGVVVLAGALTMIFVQLGIGLIVTIIGLIALGIFAILPPPEDGAAPPG